MTSGYVVEREVFERRKNSKADKQYQQNLMEFVERSKSIVRNCKVGTYDHGICFNNFQELIKKYDIEQEKLIDEILQEVEHE